MNDDASKILHGLLTSCRNEECATRLLQTIAIHPMPNNTEPGHVSRAIIAQALTMVLFDDLLNRVPTGRDYVNSVIVAGRKIEFDHGALRTVATLSGALPQGDGAITRILIPLGYEVAAVYPLTRIAMTGRAYRHCDDPEHIPQFFVSELHPERFTPAFQQAFARTLVSSREPLMPESRKQLDRLARFRALPVGDAAARVANLATCFARQHDTPRLDDYETLLGKSAEMAWISTEGNTFNHATDRVADVEAVAAEQRRAKRPIKDTVEVSSSGRLRQTAFKAAMVERDFIGAHGRIVHRQVPGSFYEFITRDPLPDGSGLDLGFDAGNAQGIFKMTSVA